MRKLFTYLAVAALVAVACDDMYGPVETPTAPDKAGSVKIQIDTLGDDTLAFTISPEGVASYYSYVVTQGSATAVDSSAVYQCKVDGLIKGTFHAATDSVATLTLGELAPNTPYTIYAVAGSPQGIPGSVSVKEVVTTDGVTIKCVDYDDTVTDSTIVLTFSEQVFLSKEGEITATYYACLPAVAEMGTVKAVADSILVDGNTVTVQFAGLPHGAYYAVNWPEGMFTDSANNKIPALTSGFDAENEEFVGVYSRKDTVAFDLVDALPLDQQMFNDWGNALFTTSAAVDSTLAATGKAKATVNYMTPGKVLTIDLVEDSTYGLAADENGNPVVWMVCPEEPAFGTTVVFSYPQDAFRDIWGNPTKAIELASLCAYDYTFDAILGTFAGQAFSYFSQTYEDSWFVIEESDDPEKGNVMITEFDGIECNASPIYATFTPTSGTLEIEGGQVFASQVGPFDEEGTVFYDFYFWTYDNTVRFTMQEAGVLSSPHDWYGIGLEGTEYQYEVYTECYMEKIAEEEVEPETASARSVKSSKMTVRYFAGK